MTLEIEIKTYDRLLPDLMANEGKYVLIIGDKVRGVFEHRDDALTLGYQATSGNFLVRQILKSQPVRFLPSLRRA